jgi:hypothetical protein
MLFFLRLDVFRDVGVDWNSSMISLRKVDQRLAPDKVKEQLDSFSSLYI